MKFTIDTLAAIFALAIIVFGVLAASVNVILAIEPMIIVNDGD